MMGRGFVTAACLGFVLASTCALLPADAAAKSKLLVKARKAYDDLDYTRAQTLLQRALKTQPAFEDEIEIYELLATVHAIYGRDDQAREAFLEVLKRNPEAELPPDTSPKIKAAFADARSSWTESGSPRISPPAPGTGPESIDTENTEGEEEPKSATPDGETGRKDTPPIATVEPVDPLMKSATTFERSEPIYKKWWFWTIVGAVAVGGGATTWYLTRPKTPAHDFGPFPLQ